MSELKRREDMDPNYLWRLEDFFKTDDDFNKEMENVDTDIKKFEDFKGKLGESSDTLADCLDFYGEIAARQERLYVYANMRLNQDESNAFYKGLSDRANALSARVAASAAFMEPEILAIDEAKLNEFLKEDRLEIYNHFITDITRMRKHYLDESAENVLAQVSEIMNAPKSIYETLTDADLTFGKVTTPEGEEMDLTTGRFVNFLRHPDRDFREKVFNQYYDSYKKVENTIATSYSQSVTGDLFSSRVRNFDSSRQAALYQNDIDESVYDNLISVMRDKQPLMHRYMDVRKKALGVDKLKPYDVYVPLVKDIKMDIPYEEAQDIIKESLKPLGSEYLEVLDTCFNDSWVDVYENKGKASGAYSWGAYLVHPYVLMNYDNQLDDMFTLTHEAGHALHRHYSIEEQPMIYYSNAIFTAEVASTFNEAMLLNHLLEIETDPEKRKYILNHYLEMFRGTMFRQTQFAEFEYNVHKEAEEGKPVELNRCNEMYRELNHDYFGDAVEFPEISDLEWARIPHFYRAYYVYQYATGFAAAISLSNRVLNGGEEEVEDYINFLKGGSCDYPINLLKGAGVDMSTKKPVEDALAVFEEVLEEFEELMK